MIVKKDALKPEQIIDNIQKFLDARKSKNKFIPEDQSEDIIKGLATKHSLDINQRWLWEGKVSTLTIDYYSNEGDGISSINNFLNRFDQNIFLVITDDEFFPWTMFWFPKTHLIELLEDNSFFTHHNCLQVYSTV